MIQHYVTDQIWFDCEHCGKKITHHSMHDCFVMNPDVLPTMEEWQLICKMVKQHELTEEKTKEVYTKNLTEMYKRQLDFTKELVKKAREK
jgi:hypothetical protein